MPSLWIQNARVIDPASKRDATGDLFVTDGRLVDSLSRDAKRRAKKIDARGLVACPGLVDIHVHFREPGQSHKETIATGSRAAAAGGFTTVVCMPNTTPPADNVGTIQYINDAIRRDAVVKVHPTGCITVGMKGQALAPFGSLQRAGVVAITDDGDCVQSNEVMRRACEYAKMFDLPLMDHCQDTSMTQGAVMNEGVVSTRLGLRGWPNAAEDLIVARNIVLASYTGARIHLQHISSGQSVEMIRRAKKRGVSITAEATPHHIALTDAALVSYDPNFKMNPPLRTEEDRQEIIAGLRDGVLDCISTDHAPHTDYEKDKEIDFAPNGIIGLETSLAVVLEVLVKQQKFKLPQVVDLMTRRPADILKLKAGTLAVGAPADICLFDPAETWRYDAKAGLSKSSNSPWHGHTFTGRVKTTIVDGRVVYANGRIV
ncbi:dihydroorotase [Opitutus terrae]|uniref:Dihydroorotase n=1 Tax=Opitutus terrae (strain DSM 11246 / JCM 15787 / PB90-1) TaxID=452637 RepID=B1ZT04_OPITP|nr:dihydroorotase [Opitutus terrae]ACB75793.1 dihydroorotase, multifunctional complex type [Opitutus terrae PB90-1]